MDIYIKQFALEEVSNTILDSIKDLLNKSYFNSKMYMSFLEDIKEDHKYFRLFVAYNDKTPIGVAVLEDKVHKDTSYDGYPPVHLKRSENLGSLLPSWIAI